MPEKQSKKPDRRRFTDKQKQQAVLFAEKHGAARAATHVGVHSSVIYAWRKRLGQDSPSPRVVELVNKEVYLLCRKLQGAIRAERQTGAELSDVEIYATLLLRAVTGKKGKL